MENINIEEIKKEYNLIADKLSNCYKNKTRNSKEAKALKNRYWELHNILKNNNALDF